MKEYYSIGETARLFNISVQTLRHYEGIGLIAPKYINPTTGYRYYTQKQFHYIDRIRYLKSLGLSLKEIREILQSGRVDDLQYFLHKSLAERREELRNLQEKISDLQWYIKYFQYMDSNHDDGQVYVSTLEKRYMLCAPCASYEPFQDIEIRLTRLMSGEPFKDLRYQRQYGFLIDFNDMMQQRFSPTAASIYLSKRPDIESPYITTLPAGDYLCFIAQLRLNHWDCEEVRRFFDESNYKPAFVVANEYEDNLVEYVATPYEVQIYLQKKG